MDVTESAELLERARQVQRLGIRAKDALHVACAIAAGCSVFLTMDDRLIRRMRGYTGIAVMNPAQFVVEAEP